MNRDIKFRVWDGVKKKMFMDYNLLYSAKHSRILSGHTGSWIFDNNLPVMQYIGIEDKNGTDIYEGDIVSLYCSTNKDHVVTASICWLNGYAAYEAIIHDKQVLHKISGKMVSMREMHSWVGAHSCLGHSEGIEVIGNIHENPELLKEVKDVN